MRIDILSLFPKITESVLEESMMKRAQAAGLVEFHSHNIRDWSTDRHHTVDDAPYGGGQGMVLKCEPIFAAVEALKTPAARVILMSPGGQKLSHEVAAKFLPETHLIILCGHYEGVDQRVIEHLVDEEISIGDYVLTNGAIAALILVDCVVRLIPGVLGNERSAQEDSFVEPLLEAPHYTRPLEFRGWRVPDVLLSGHHEAVAAWRREQALEKTRRVRPDLL